MELNEDELAQANIGDLLRHFRTRVGWSQHDLADALGVSDGMVGNVERGTRNLGIGNAETLIQALDLSSDEAQYVRDARQRAATRGGDATPPQTVTERLTVVERRLDAIDEKLDRLLDPTEAG